MRTLFANVCWLLVTVGIGACATTAPEPVATETPLAAAPQLPPPQHIVLSTSASGMVCAGVDTQLIITAIDAQGRPWITQGAGGGEVPWNAWQFQALNATVSADGLLRPVGDFQALVDQSVGVRAAPVAYPERMVESFFPISFACPYVFAADGQAGQNGANGRPGAAAPPGANLPTSGPGAAPGQDGGTGGDGQNGADGERGGDGHNLELEVALVQVGAAQQPMLQVMVHDASTGGKTPYFIDPVGGTLHLSVRGGNGGAGGAGGVGGDGGAAGAGTTDGNGGNGGKGGDGGMGGDGGNGGQVRVRIDKSARPYQSFLVVDASGGMGGPAAPGGQGGGGGAGRTYSNPGNRGANGAPGAGDGRLGTPGSAVQWQYVRVKPLW